MTIMLSQWLLSTAVFSILLLTTVKSQLTIDSDRIVRKEIGSEASFKCSDHSGVIRAEDIRWNYTETRDANFTLRVTNENGTLIITSLVESDSGEYLCIAAKSKQSLRAVLKVFKMPNYTQYGITMTGIAGALLLILIVGQIIMTKQERQQERFKVHKRNAR